MNALSVACDACGKTYKLKPELLGKRVKCAACGAAFVASATAGDARPAAASAQPAGSAVAAAKQPFPAVNSQARPASPNKIASPNKPASPTKALASPEGPTDRQLRFWSLVGVPGAVVGVILVLVMRDLGTKGLFILAFAPFAFCFGIAALIDPNIIRAAGKYGKHLPKRYKLIAGAVGVVALAISGCLSTWVYLTQIR